MSTPHSFRSWLFRRVFRRRATPPLQQPGARPNLERLEDRLPPGDLLHLPGAFSRSTGRATARKPASTQSTTTAPKPAQTATPVSVAQSSGQVTRQRQSTPPAASQPPVQAPQQVTPDVFARGIAGTSNRLPSAPGVGGAAAGSGLSRNGPTIDNGGNHNPNTPITPIAPVTPGTPGNPTVPPPTTTPPTSNPTPPAIRITAIKHSTAGRDVRNQLANDARPVIAGVAPRGQAVKVWVNNRVVGTTVASNQGAWSLRSPLLADGLHVFTSSASSATRAPASQGTLRVDTRAPILSLQAPEFVRHREQAWVQVSVTEPDSNGFVQRFVIDVDLNNDGRFLSHELGYKSSANDFQVLTNLPKGTYRMRARVQDNAGNVGVSPVVTMGVDPFAGIVGSQILRDLGGIDPVPPGGLPNYADQVRIVDGKVLLDVRAITLKQLPALRTTMEGLGFEHLLTVKDSILMTGWFPMENIRHLETIPSFSGAVPVFKPVVKRGSVTSGGVAAMKADVFSAQEGVTGRGVKVGVVSDSVNRVQGGLADSVRTGDLPNNVQVLQDGMAGGIDEGRAMLEIVHDVAPGAALAFSTADFGPTGFANSILNLAANGCDVITDDIGYSNSPLFNAGRIGKAVDDVTTRGAVYTTAGSNDGDRAWRATWTPISTTVGGVNGTFQRFGNGALQTFTLPQNARVVLSFGWDATYFEGGGIDVPNNLDVLLVRVDTGAVVMTFNNVNQNTDEAFEQINFTNNLNVTNFALAYRLVSGPAPTRLGFVDLGSAARPDIQALDQGATTIFGQTLAANALTLGAADAATPDVPEMFSGFGGRIDVFANDQGVRLPAPVLRAKPEITGPDNVRTSFFDSQNMNFFLGTSAAAPHAAAAAALLLEQQPAAMAIDIRDHIIATVRDIENPGFDPVSGFGFIQLERLDVNTAAFEPNETSDKAREMGTVSGTEVLLAGLEIRRPGSFGFPDYDWFKFSAGRSGIVRVEQSNPRLELHVFRQVGGFLEEIRSGARVTAGTKVFVEVKGQPLPSGLQTEGSYRLKMQIT